MTTRTKPKVEEYPYIAEALRPLAVPIDSVQPYPGNPRQGDVGAIVTSLRRFGQQKPLVVQDATGYIVAGNHVWKAGRDLGWTHIAVNRSDLSDWEARSFLIADNRMSDLGTYDEAIMAAILKEIAEANDLLGTGFDGDDVDDLLKKVEEDSGGGVKGEIAFSEELMEAHNYVVLYFDNELDWNLAVEKLGIEVKRTPDSTPTYHRAGIGRVIRGVDVVRRLE
jgi:ParB-like chromosome segregation protein Spo0J